MGDGVQADVDVSVILTVGLGTTVLVSITDGTTVSSLDGVGNVGNAVDNIGEVVAHPTSANSTKNIHIPDVKCFSISKPNSRHLTVFQLPNPTSV